MPSSKTVQYVPVLPCVTSNTDSLVNQFKANLSKLYPIIMETLSRDLDIVVRQSVREVLIRVGVTSLGITGTIVEEEDSRTQE